MTISEIKNELKTLNIKLSDIQRETGISVVTLSRSLSENGKKTSLTKYAALFFKYYIKDKKRAYELNQNNIIKS